MKIKDNRKVAVDIYVGAQNATLTVLHPGGEKELLTLKRGESILWLPIGSYFRTAPVGNVVVGGATIDDVKITNFDSLGSVWYILKEGVHYYMELT